MQRISIGEHEVLIKEHFHDESPKRVGSVGAADLTGLKVWPLADPLLRRLQANVLPSLRQLRGSDDLRPLATGGLRVLELGSGQGLLGIALAAQGDEVVLTDPAVDFGGSASATNTLSRLRGNIDLNRDLVGRRASAEKLLWGNETDMAAVQGKGPFDLVIGCEVIYNSESHAPLLATLKRFSSESLAPVVLGYLERNTGESEFLDLARLHFDVDLEPIDLGSVSAEAGGMQARLAVCHPKRTDARR